MLYDPAAFERLTDEPWDEARAGRAIREIVADADAAFDAEGLWPAHDWDGWQAALPLKNLYVGAAGVVWALEALRRRGHAESTLDLASAARRALEAWRAQPDLIAGMELPAPPEAGLLTGESGILVVAWQLCPSPELADELFAHVRRNVENQANELMWGAPGTMLAAATMLAWTREERWGDAWRESADELWRRREPDGLWTQRLYGQTARSLGPPHGLVGNARILLQSDLLAPERRDALAADTAVVLARCAVREDGLANWPCAEGRDLVGSDGETRVQWCCGAPGIAIAAANELDEDLLLEAVELVWRAGPPGLEKGPGICHGTAGNGYAFLKAFERTGDERWLERARRFAVHALGQVQRLRAEHGRGRYSLWTGDVGAALFAADCLDGRGVYPIVDSWE